MLFVLREPAGILRTAEGLYLTSQRSFVQAKANIHDLIAAMAKMSSLLAVLLLLAVFIAFSAEAHKVPAGYTSAHIRGFWQDYLNTTDFILLAGLKDVGTGVTPVSGPFGTMVVYDDPFTLTADRHSKVIGSIRGTGSVCALDGLTTCWSFTIKLLEGAHKGTLTFASAIATSVSDVAPIAGGTGDFLFAEGFRTTNTTTRVDLHVFWPPYAH